MKLHSTYLIDLLTFNKSHFIAKFLKNLNLFPFFLIIIVWELNLMHWRMAYDERRLSVHGTNKHFGLHWWQNWLHFNTYSSEMLQILHLKQNYYCLCWHVCVRVCVSFEAWLFCANGKYFSAHIHSWIARTNMIMTWRKLYTLHT